MSANTTLATRGQSATAETGIKKLLLSDSTKEALMQALPKFYTADQFTVIVRTAINKNPKLQDCTPESFMVALLTAAQMGIAPDGRNGHLIPRNRKVGQNWISEVQFQPDYKGLVGLIRRNNDNVSDIYAEVVHDKDEIHVTKGLKRDLIHEVDIRAERGPIIGVYAVISYRDGTPSSFEYMSRPEVEAIRARSDSWKKHVSDNFSTPWITDEGEMFKKTVLKRLLKLADLSEDTSERLQADPELTYAQAVEIKPAQLPDRQPAQVALPARTEEPAPVGEATPITAEIVGESASEKLEKPADSPAKSAKVEKSAPAAKSGKKLEARKTVEEELTGKAEPDPAEAAAPAAELTPHQKLVADTEKGLKAGGYTVPQLIAVCKKNEWGEGWQKFDPASTTVADIDMETLESFFADDNWTKLVLVELAELPSEAR